ncbi:glycosyltransferase [Nonlabens marinus]
MDEVLVTIIIPTYNRAHLIGKTLESVKDQAFQY